MMAHFVFVLVSSAVFCLENVKHIPCCFDWALFESALYVDKRN